MDHSQLVTTEKRENLFLICFNRPEERNAVNMEMIQQLSHAFTEYENDPTSRCAVLYANGKHFTFGLQLEEVSKALLEQGRLQFPKGSVDPFGVGFSDRKRTKPLVTAVHGFCLTLGIELMLASDIVIAAEKTRFAQMEVQRGILPFGGATIRFIKTAGWGNSMRYLLTGDDFGTEEAFRMGLVQEVVPKKELLDRALLLASKISKQAPLAVRAVIANAKKSLEEGENQAIEELSPLAIALLQTEDGKEGVKSFLERREPIYLGR
ncbi:crotonase/enoyl-CoA hydratase family protein [Leptospira congkakensis]|uniref:Crotonase/enoyl-CoA hydratase family protein n=1 Tax=Leptospira congkakensis TaxID=2484932 RepID=A0A4Z1A817_9LEPT|nr:crotonase/enoyl-CoA hydratase family protein [Leptospira congkakensis]TGL87500.1 crotonase/enoyl-CoA hydratase family protein [Leptospira congkakensis]TGL89885.1 crotonase/enoyl-CoA hydratase family protein [Leptospira congkakensis]TGL95649.1 crotonase/enoyl-CoA hydratase family protein [Leptospira congkakensis]